MWLQSLIHQLREDDDVTLNISSFQLRSRWTYHIWPQHLMLIWHYQFRKDICLYLPILKSSQNKQLFAPRRSRVVGSVRVRGWLHAPLDPGAAAGCRELWPRCTVQLAALHPRACWEVHLKCRKWPRLFKGSKWLLGGNYAQNVAGTCYSLKARWCQNLGVGQSWCWLRSEG